MKSKDKFFLHNKNAKTTTGTGPPKKNEGHDGDFSIRLLNHGLFLYAKFNRRWYVLGELQSAEIAAKKRILPPMDTLPGTVQGGSGGSGGSGGISGVPAMGKLYLNLKGSARAGTKKGDSYFQYVKSGGGYKGNLPSAVYAVVKDRQMMAFIEDGSSSQVLMNQAVLNIKTIVFDANPGATLGDTYITAGSGSDNLEFYCGSKMLMKLDESPSSDAVEWDLDYHNLWSSVANMPQVELRNRTNDANGPLLKISNRRTGAIGVNNDYAGSIEFAAEDEDASETIVGRIKGQITDVSAGSEAGALILESVGDNTSAIKLDSAGDVYLDCHTAKDIYLQENGSTYTPSAADHATPKHYVDLHQMHSVQDNYRFTATTTSRTYFKNIDTLSQDNMWSAYDTEDDTVVGNTISLQVEESVAGLIVPYACKLKGVRWVGGNDENNNHEVLLQTWTGSAVPDNTISTTAVTATLRSSISLTNYNRKYFNQSGALDVAMAAGTMIYPAFQFVSGGTINYHGSVVDLLERA